jgi:LCP family protein required for cell wall assembly
MRKRTPVFIRILKGFYIFIVILSALIVGAFCTYKVMVHPPEMELPSAPVSESSNPASGSEEPNATKAPSKGLVRKEGVYTFLIFGMDDGSGNTDTIMVGSYDTMNRAVHVISIPRDTMIETDRANKRVNAVHASEGVAGLEQELSDMLGIPIDFYIKVNLQAFVAIVDAVGGIDYNVPVDMDYEDPTQDLYIHLKKGMQHLNGEKALQMVRCRNAYANQDIGRMATQQDFLSGLSSKVLQLGNVTKVREFASIFNEYVETDLRLGHIIWFGEQLLSLCTENISFETIPIHSAGYVYRHRAYVTLDMENVLNTVNETLNPYTTDLKLSDLDMMSVIDDRVVHSRAS